MTVILYDNKVLYTDSKKVSVLQSESFPLALRGEKIRVIADGAIAYACCGTALNLYQQEALDGYVKAMLFVAWLSRQSQKVPMPEKIGKVATIWNRKYNTLFPEPENPVHMIAMTRDLTLNIKCEGARFNPTAAGTFLDITEESGHILSMSPVPFHIYRRLGASTVESLKKVIASSDLCDLPIQMQRAEDLAPINYEGFVDYLVKLHADDWDKPKGAK